LVLCFNPSLDQLNFFNSDFLPNTRTLKEIANLLDVTTDYPLGKYPDKEDTQSTNHFDQTDKLKEDDIDIIQLLIDRLVDDE